MPGPFSGAKSRNPARALANLQYLPPAQNFVPATVDIFSGTGSYPITGTARASGVPCLVSGNWMAGHRQAVSAADAHTHVMLLDPSIEIRDPYRGNAQATGITVDAIRTNGEGLPTLTSPWRFVVISFLSVVPGIGRRKVVVLDQRNNYSASVLLKDTFTDTALTLLDGGSAHVMDVGAGWTVNPGGNLQVNPSLQLDLVIGTAPSRCWAESGRSDVSSASVDVQSLAANGAGLAMRISDQNNSIEFRLSTSTGRIIKRNAGAETVLATQNVSLNSGTKHTVACVLSGSSLTGTFDGANILTATDSFNSTVTKHGCVQLTDAGSAYAKLANFVVNQ